MSTLKAYGDVVVSIFQLIVYKENDIIKSIAWALNKCPVFMKYLESMLDVTEDGNFFVYKLGSAIVPPKELRNRKIYPNRRVWDMLDILLT